jgi:hypothetical protein
MNRWAKGRRYFSRGLSKPDAGQAFPEPTTEFLSLYNCSITVNENAKKMSDVRHLIGFSSYLHLSYDLKMSYNQPIY